MKKPKKCYCTCHKVNQGLQKPNPQTVHCPNCYKENRLVRKGMRETAPVQRATILKECDTIYTQIVRVRGNWTCIKCGRYFRPELHETKFKYKNRLMTNSHYWSRGIITLRFDDRNCDPMCLFCHMKVENNKERTVENFNYKTYMIEKLGKDGYDKLEQEAQAAKVNPIKMNLYHLSIKRNQLKEELRITLEEYTGI